MSDGPVVDSTRLERLLHRFEEASYEHLGVDAVVVYRPDIRADETDVHVENVRSRLAVVDRLAGLDRRVQVLGLNQALGIDHPPVSFAETLDFTVDHARRFAVRSVGHAEVIPPYPDRTVEALGLARYWRRRLSADQCPDFTLPPGCRDLWDCTLFGPPPSGPVNTAALLFNQLAEDTARLILPRSDARGTGLLSRWLIHLADRVDPIVPGSQRQYLSWRERAAVFPPAVGLPHLADQCYMTLRTSVVVPWTPSWVPVTPQNFPRNYSSSPHTDTREARWWAVLLPNVFRLSRDAVRQFIGSQARAPSECTTPPKGGDADRPSLPSSGANQSPREEAEEFRLVRSGAFWEIRGLGEGGNLPDLKGVTNLAQLLWKPGQYVPWAELLNLPAVADRRNKQSAITPEALRNIQADRRRLQVEIDEAEDDVERADSERRLAELNAQAVKDIGLGRKPRDVNNPIPGYRAKVHGRLRDVYAKMRVSPRPMGKLADHFEKYITSATEGYIYDPPMPPPQWWLDHPTEISR